MKYKFLQFFVLAVLILIISGLIKSIPVLAAGEFTDCRISLSSQSGTGGSHVVVGINGYNGTGDSPGSPIEVFWGNGNSDSFSYSDSLGNHSGFLSNDYTVSGTYSITAMDSLSPVPNSCTGSFSVTVTAPVTGSCSATPNPQNVNSNVTWSAVASGGTGTYAYSWSGTDGLSGTTSSVTKSYSTSGSKTGTVSVTSGTQVVTINCSPSLTILAAASYSLSILKAGTGSGTVAGISSPTQANINCGASCAQDYSSGTIVNLTATPSGSTFTGWSGGNLVPPLDNDCVDGLVTMNEDKTCTATFTAIPTLSCAVDTATTPAPHYPNSGVKFLASGGTGTYAWTATGGTPSSGTGNQIWPSYSTSGTKTVTVESGSQTASCTVDITPEVTMSGTLTAPDCTITAGGNSCTTTLSWNVTNPENIGGTQVTSSYPSTGTVVAPPVSTGTADSGTKTGVTIPYSSRTFYLYNNMKSLVPTSPSGSGVIATATCISGTAWDTVSGTCKTSTTPVNGSCAVTHNNCNAGTSVDVTDTTTLFKWSCNGLNGGTNEACTEAKTIDLTASAPTPTTDVAVNVTRTYTSTITNQGTVSTGASFPYFFQLSSPWWNEAGATIYDRPSSTMSALAANGGSASATISYAFTGEGHKSIRVCADKTSSAGGGVITESDETNNCSPWTNLSSTPAAAMSGTLTASNCTIALNGSSCNSTLNWTTTNPEATSEVTTPTNISVGTGLNGSATYSVAYGSRTFYLYNNAKSLVPTSPSGSGVVATATCVTGTGWDGSKCAAAGVPVDGDWSDWSSCTQICGGGTKTRTCTSPIPQNGGASCALLDGGDSVRACNTQACVGGEIVNGVCLATHYSCSSGISANNVNGVSKWTWNCNGSGGGATVSCEEFKKKPIFIEE